MNSQNETKLILNPIDQTRPIEGVSEKYGFVSSRAILDTFESKGWTVDSMQRAKVRNASRQGFEKHVVWLKNPDFGPIDGLSKDNASIPRLCLVNSHDMSTATMIYFGVLRIACENQLVTGNVLRYFRTVHSKNVLTRLGDGIDYMSDGIPELIESVQKLQNIELSPSQRLEYSRLMIDARFQNVKNVVSIDYSVTERALRLEDQNQDAYTVLNRVQEYIIRGGIPFSYMRQSHDENGQVIGENLVHGKTRKIASIATQLRLNQALTENIFKVAA